MVELRTLGLLDLRDAAGAEIRSVLQQPKRLALLAFLAIAAPHRYHRRDALFAMFWPESDEEHARAALRGSLHFLRSALGAATIAGRGEEEVSVCADQLWCDAVACDEALRSGNLTGALELYCGDLLEGFHVSEAPGFQDWLERERGRLRDSVARAAWSLAEAAERTQKGEEAGRWGRRALELTPQDEDALHRLLGLLDRVGDRSGAIHAYDDFARRMVLENNFEPAPATRALIETIRTHPALRMAPPSPASVAVLPFLNLSVDRQNEYFSDGMTEEILNALTKVPGLKVACRTSVFAFQGKTLDIREIAERLNVRTVLEGSVRRAGSRVRVTAQLISAADGYHLWSETYDREMADVFALQDEISRAIVEALEFRLAEDPSVPLVRPGTSNVEAYELYLRGRFLWNTRSPEGLQKSVRYFEQSTAADPAYALPRSGLADSYHLLSVYGIMRARDAYPRAKAAALRAVEINDQSAEAHCSLGCVALCYDWDWNLAEQEFTRAIRLDPSYAAAHYWYAWFLTAMNRGNEAVAMVRRVTELEPLSLILQARAGHILCYWGHTQEALRYCERALELDPTFPVTYEVLALVYSRLSRLEDAVAALEHLSGEMASRGAAMLPYVYAMGGRLDEAKTLLERSGYDPEGGRVPSGYLVIWPCAAYAAIGDADAAFRWLALMYEERLFPILLCNVEQGLLKPLRTDPRFSSLLERIGLPNRDQGR